LAYQLSFQIFFGLLAAADLMAEKQTVLIDYFKRRLMSLAIIDSSYLLTNILVVLAAVVFIKAELARRLRRLAFLLLIR
jgi:hypothetical protein